MKLHMTSFKLGRLAIAALAAVGIGAGVLAGVGVAEANTNSLATPRVTAVTPRNATTIEFTWEDREARETHYNVTLYGQSAEGWADGVLRELTAPAVPGQGGTGRMTIANLRPDTGYCVAVRAVAGHGPNAEDSHSSNEMCARTPKGAAGAPAPMHQAEAPPAKPHNLRAEFSRGIAPAIELSWSDVQGETSYSLIAVNLVTFEGRAIATGLPANTTSFMDFDSIFETDPFEYQLRACNSHGCSDAATLIIK